MTRSTYDPTTAPEVAHEGLEPVREGGYSQKIAYAPPVWQGYENGNYNVEVKAAGGGEGLGAQKRICGLTAGRFWLCVLLIVLIIGGAVGGGLGGGFASQKSNDAASTPTKPPSASSPIPSPTTDIGTQTPTATPTSTSETEPYLNSGCNSTNNQFYTPLNLADSSSPFTINKRTLKYKIHCYTNIPDRTSGHNPEVTKLAQLQNISSLQGCITACATMNHVLQTAWGNDDVPFSSMCSGVVYSYSGYVAGRTINCDLNTSVMENSTRVRWTDNRGPETHTEVDSAVLDWE